MGASALMQVLHQLPAVRDKDLIAGIETCDDAGVYKVSDGLAVVNTVDFFPPIVDDPFTFGSIAAANALSDVYAMGGVPRLAMNIVCFPGKLPLEALGDIIKGAADKLAEAGVIIIGGHSIEDDGIKYGLSVTGFVDPKKVVKNSGARPGD
ncbi:MAG: selenide, water dikinase SelD, partial [Deltaproteobacteria bacterium]|nr:selenide, water dikinase SelD [Deltaproteobacteria bacterium]